jgi:hypothetical protein
LSQIIVIFDQVFLNKQLNMSDLEVLENIGTAAVMQLRKEQLASGNFFMINSKDLPARQGYLEYPDGTINLVTIAADERSFTTIRKLSIAEANILRQQFNL